MAFIQVRKTDALVTGLTDEQKRLLDMWLSYRPAGYQFEPAFKHRRWDGWVHLFDRNGYFPVGLLFRVQEFLESKKIPYRTEMVEVVEDGLPVQLELNPQVESRWYQDEAVIAATALQRGVIRVPTGGGKSVIAARVIQKLGRHAVVVVPTIDLLLQLHEFLEWALQTHVGRLGAGIVDPQPVTVATTKTLSRVLKTEYFSYSYLEGMDDDETQIADWKHTLSSWARSIGVMIIDEAHCVAADTAYNLATAMPVRYKIGLSASPWRDDNADLKIEAALGPVIYRVSAKNLVDGGFLVPPVFRVIKTDPKPLGKDITWSQAYSKTIANNQERHRIIAERVTRLLETRKAVLILVKQLKHGEALRKLLPGAIFIAGSSPADVMAFHQSGDRQRVLDQLRSGEIRCVIATTIADMGVDIPLLDTLVLAGGGKSSTRHLQRIGRVCRPFPGKDHAEVYDFDDSAAHKWFGQHQAARLRIERDEWEGVALWL